MSEATLGLRETLENAIGETPQETPEIIESAPVETAGTETEAESEARARDDRGRFAKKQEEAEQLLEAATETPVEPVREAKPSPKAWKKELAEKYWNNLDPDLQEEILRREEAVSRGFEQYKTDAQYASDLKQVIDPYNDYINQMGVSAPAAIDHLLKSEYQLRNGTPYEKAQLFMQWANAYGVNLEELATQRPDPAFAMQSELAQLRGMYNQLIQTQQQTQDKQVLSEIEQFAATHEHLDTVREDMALLLQAGKASNLDEAYEKAIRLHDDLFNQVNGANQQMAEAQRREQADRAAKAAKAAAVSVKGSRSGVSQTPPGNLRDALSQAFDGRL
jgi:hypothetical protein